MPRLRSDRQPDAELARPPADRECQDARDADHCNRQRNGREDPEYDGIQPIGREHFRANVFERRSAFYRLVRRHVPNDTADRRHQCVGIPTGVDEQTARPSLLLR